MVRLAFRGLAVRPFKQDHPGDDQRRAQQLARGDRLVEEQRPPHKAPHHRHGLIGKGRGEGNALDDLLPANGVHAQQQDHRAVVQAEAHAQKALPGRLFAADLAHGIEHQHQVQGEQGGKFRSFHASSWLGR